jgi:hypothetical protein
VLPKTIPTTPSQFSAASAGNNGITEPTDATDLDEDSRPDDIAVDPFPLEVLPEQLAEFVTEAACAISCPPDYIAVPMLSVLGTAIGTRQRIKIKEGWLEFPTFWTATVGDTGTAKSPGQEKAVEPLDALQSKLLAEYTEARKADFFVKKSAAGVGKKTKGQRKDSSRAELPRDDYDVDTDASLTNTGPQFQQVFTTDTTLEALNWCLARNPHGIALVRDELTAWVLGMNEYKKGAGADRPHWQSVWNSSQIVVNRKNTRRPIIIPRPFVCVIGGIPPDMLGELCDERGREDGFIHRILFAFPERVPRMMTDQGIRPEMVQRYREVFNGLRTLRLNILLEDQTVTRELAPEAWAIFRDWANQHYVEMENGPTNLRGPWAKLVTYCARLALLLHLIRTVCDESVPFDVDEDSVRRAITLISYFKSHTRKVYRHLHASAEDIQMAAAIEWLRKRKECVASARDFVTNKVGRVRTTQQALELFSKLEENNWGHTDHRVPATGGRRTTLFFLDCRRIADRSQTLIGGRK